MNISKFLEEVINNIENDIEKSLGDFVKEEIKKELLDDIDYTIMDTIKETIALEYQKELCDLSGKEKVYGNFIENECVEDFDCNAECLGCEDAKCCECWDRFLEKKKNSGTN